MKKIFALLLIILFCLTGCSNTDYNSYNYQNTDNYSASKVSVHNTLENNSSSIPNIQTNLSSFSTKIYTPNDSARMKNIELACSKLNGTIVKSRCNFFFL